MGRERETERERQTDRETEREREREREICYWEKVFPKSHRLSNKKSQYKAWETSFGCVCQETPRVS